MALSTPQQDAARVAVKLILGLGVANTVDYFTCHALKVDIRFAGNLSREEYLSCGHHGLAGHVGLRIKGQQLVKNSITYLIGHLVGMTFRHRF